MKRILLSILFATVWAWSLGGADRSYQFHHFDTSSSGLSFNDVRCLLQDSRGYVWVGTRYGLNRFDGSRFKVYHKEELGTSSDYIYCLWEDDRGNIWAGTGRGVAVYDYGSDRFLCPALPDGAGCFEERIFCIGADSSGQLWMGAGNGCLYSCLPQERILREHRLEGRPEGTMTMRLAIDRNDHIFLSLYCDDLYLYDRQTGGLQPLALGERQGYFHGDDIAGIVVHPKSNDLVFVAGKRSGLCEVDLRRGGVRTLLPPDKDQKYGSIQLDAAQNIWLSTTAGLYRYSLKDGKCRLVTVRDGDRFSLADNDISCSIVDSGGNLWVGTTWCGLDCAAVRQDMFAKVWRTGDGEPLHSCNIKGVVQDSRDRVWLASEKLGLLEYLPDTGTVVRRGRSKALPGLTSICVDGDHLWLGSRTGVYRYSPDRDLLRYYPSFAEGDFRVTSLCRLISGRVLAGTTGGMMEYDPAADTFRQTDIGCASVDVIAEDSFGVVWMASYSDGLYAYDSHQDRLLGHWNGDGFPNMMSSVIVNDDDEVWALSFGSGFYRYDRKEEAFRKYDRSTLPALPSDVFYYALTDAKGNLWLSSDAGLVSFNPASGTVRRLDVRDGLLDDAYSQPALKLSSGKFLFTSVNGFVVFDPAAALSTDGDVTADITDLVLPSGPVVPSPKAPVTCNVNTADTIRLAPGRNSFSLYVATPRNLFTPVNLFAQLSGRESLPGKVTASGEIGYADLPHGTYTLELFTEGGSGRRISVHKPITLIVDPPFWQSPAGVALTALAVLGLMLTLLLSIYRSDRRKQARALAAYQQVKEEEMAKEKIAFFSNVIHEIKTPLMLFHTPLRNLLSMDEVPQASRDELNVIKNSSDYLDNLVKELLDFIRMEEFGYPVSKHNIDLVERLDYIYLNFADAAKNRNISLSFSHEGLDSLVVAADPKALNKIVDNLLHNAVKYAETRISVRLARTEDGAVQVRFGNDGPPIPAGRRREIFKPFVQFGEDQAPYSQNFGIGLALARTLAEASGGTLELADRAETEFVLTLPYEVLPEDVQPFAAPAAPEDGGATGKTVLLVEDNADLLSYLALKVGDEYNVVPASSAESALDIVDKRRIDIIVTDISLGAMNGIELCRRICADFETSHIPVVMISAISSEQTKIKCMEVGAAVYIEKPFTIDYLKACMAGILRSRSSLKTIYSLSGAESTDLSAFNIEEKDSTFLAHLEAVVMKHIGDDTFSVRQLESELYMSHTALNKKMNGLLNISPIDYIRTKRLSIAARLIAQGEGRINEVCYSVGFTSPSYFTKCFKAAYGLTPTEYAATHASEQGRSEIAT